jgi:hypothetical protein
MIYMYADMNMQMMLKPMRSDAARGDHMEIEV